jgi:hypothetical protein
VVGGCDLYVQRSDGEMPSTAPAMSSGNIRPRIQYSLAPQGERPTRDLPAFILSVGGLLAVAGLGLLVLWAVLNWVAKT